MTAPGAASPTTIRRARINSGRMRTALVTSCAVRSQESGWPMGAPSSAQVTNRTKHGRPIGSHIHQVFPELPGTERSGLAHHDLRFGCIEVERPLCRVVPKPLVPILDQDGAATVSTVLAVSNSRLSTDG